MAVFDLSRRAVADLQAIGRHALDTCGSGQAVRYLDALKVCCQTLADKPGIGRACDDVCPGLNRFEHASHVIFYRLESDGIWISRILHERMVPVRARFTA